ncbi:MAG: TIM barrel protein [Bacillota bacterium]
MKLATQDKPFFPTNFLEKLTVVKSMGFEAFEIDGKVLVDQFEEVKQASQQVGLPISTACGGYGGWIGDFDNEKRQRGLEDISKILKRIGELGGKGIVVPAAWGMFSKRLPPLVPPRSDEEDRSVLLDSLCQLQKVAEQTGTVIYLEPLNRYEDHMINTISNAVSLIKAGSFANVKVIADFFHMNIEEANIEESLKQYKEYIGHIHLADSHRYQPGHGHLDFVPGFKALREIGYEGYMAFECRVLGDNEEELYRSSVDFIKECFKKSK